MLTRFVRLVGGVLVLASLCTGVFAQQPTVKIFQVMYNKEDAATVKHDLAGAMAFLAPDFHADVPGTGHVDYAAQKKQLQQIFATAKSIVAKSVVKSVKVQGKVVHVMAAEEATIVIANPQTGKPATLVVTSSSDDSWEKRSGHWQRTTMQIKSQHMTMDGKAVGGM